jgi:hypothetical protein
MICEEECGARCRIPAPGVCLGMATRKSSIRLILQTATRVPSTVPSFTRSPVRKLREVREEYSPLWGAPALHLGFIHERVNSSPEFGKYATCCAFPLRRSSLYGANILIGGSSEQKGAPARSDGDSVDKVRQHWNMISSRLLKTPSGSELKPTIELRAVLPRIYRAV